MNMLDYKKNYTLFFLVQLPCRNSTVVQLILHSEQLFLGQNQPCLEAKFNKEPSVTV